MQICWGFGDREAQTIHFQDFFDTNPQKNSLIIGRLETNDIPLPDPEKNISRHHCVITFQQNQWQISDAGSANGTYIKRGDQDDPMDIRRHEFVTLQENDTILILGKLIDDQPLFWEFTFHDLSITKRHENYAPPYELEYHFDSQILWRSQNQQQEKIILTKQKKP